MKMKKGEALQRKAEIAIKEAIKGVIEEHRKSGRPLAVWKNGKVARISPEEALKEWRKGKRGAR